MAELTLEFDMNPIERIKLETEYAENDISKKVGLFLSKQFETDNVLANCYKDRKITLEDIYEFIYKSAEKYLNNKSGAISEDVVYGWSIHFIQDENVKVPEKESFKLTKEDENETKAKAMKRFEEEELEKIRKAEQKKKEALEKKAIKEKLKEEEERGKQLSLFDF